MDGQGADLLASGLAFADLSPWRKIGVTGPDARGWLNDLVSADIGMLRKGLARRSLLLSPTGLVRAEFTVAARDEGFLLIQDPIQPRAIDRLLAPYVLSSHVEMTDRTGELVLLALPGLSDAPQAQGAEVSMPSCLGSGLDLVVPNAAYQSLVSELSGRFRLAGQESLEAWRVNAGIPRLGVDVAEDDLPQEAGFVDAVAFDKGCYLGQEAVAKVRNLGHPRRLVIPLEADGPVSSGDPVRVEGRDAGLVTSVAALDGGHVALARVRWDARHGPFRTALGTALRTRTPTRSTSARRSVQ